MTVPSVKGSVFQLVVDDVRALVDAGRLEPEELARELSEKDRGLLDAVVTPVTWIPMATYGRMLELLAREEGGDDPVAYLCGRGARAAERLLAGTYGSFDAEPGTWGPRVGQTMIGIGRLLYNFTSWSFRQVEGELYEIEANDALEYPDTARYTALGFIRWFAERTSGSPMRVESERPTPDRIVFRVQPAD